MTRALTCEEVCDCTCTLRLYFPNEETMLSMLYSFDTILHTLLFHTLNFLCILIDFYYRIR